ncbi:FtsX-like permease family protein [Undibacterium piscinae]|uniref:FtsX-like permease family protein n=1 Tax=Undibacterium piscinae TaxID=2495591 RepID=A0A6M4A3G4_9BURK|nr:FtsX-like permease family protein [Undibacterium piscinae]
MKTFFGIRPIFSALLRNKTGPLLVAIQIGLSLAILANALYIVNLRLAVAARPSGVVDELNLFRVNISNQKLGEHADQIAMQKQEAAIIAAVPGVVSVARVNQMPLSQSGSTSGLAADRKQTTSNAMGSIYMSPDSLVQTWGLHLIEGRDFNAGDRYELDQNTTQDFPKTVIITKELAKKLYPDQASVVGKDLYFGTGEQANGVKIIGVVERLQTHGGQAASAGETSLIVPIRLSNDVHSGYSVRTEAGQRDRVMREVEAALRKSSATPLNLKSASMEEDRRTRYRSEKALAWMLIAVSALLVLVTASGIVGMSTLWVTQRYKQIGVRRALGARKIDILAYFITENILISSVGIIGGVLLALALNQLLVSQFELSKLPVSYLLFAPCLFWLLGVIAVYAPAWRAASISPATATRSA